MHVRVTLLSLSSNQPAQISLLFPCHRDEKVLKVLQTQVFGRVGVGSVFSWSPACPAFLVPITGGGWEEVLSPAEAPSAVFLYGL